MTARRWKMSMLSVVALCLVAVGANAAVVDNVGYVYQVPEDTTMTTEYANHWKAWDTNNDGHINTAFMTYNIDAYGTPWSNQYAMPGQAWDNSSWQGGTMVFAFDAAQGEKIDQFKLYINNIYLNTTRDDVIVYWSNDYITKDYGNGLILPDRAAWNVLATDPTSGSNYVFNPDSERTYLMYFLYRRAAGSDTWWTLQMQADAYRVQTVDVPEPATMSLVGLGSLAMLGRKRRK